MCNRLYCSTFLYLFHKVKRNLKYLTSILTHIFTDSSRNCKLSNEVIQMPLKEHTNATLKWDTCMYLSFISHRTQCQTRSRANRAITDLQSPHSGAHHLPVVCVRMWLRERGLGIGKLGTAYKNVALIIEFCVLCFLICLSGEVMMTHELLLLLFLVSMYLCLSSFALRISHTHRYRKR